MTRLEYWGKSETVRHPEDVKMLKDSIPELASISDAQIQDMYSHWSEDYYAAGWLIISPAGVTQFKKWLLAEIDGPEILW